MDSQQDIKESFLKFAEQTAASEASKSIAAYALEALSGWMREHDIETLTKNDLREWVADMLISGRKVSTCKRYYGKVHTTYKAWPWKSEVNPFDEANIGFDELNETHPDETSSNLGFVKRLLSKKETSDEWQNICIFFYLLYNPTATMADVVELKFDNAPQFCPQIDDIINSFDRSHGRQYVFKLNQGHSRPNEIERNLTSQLHKLLLAAGMLFEHGFSRTSITALWITAALRENVSLHDIRAIINIIPTEYSALSLIEKREINTSDKERIICRVADAINSQAKRWHVMKLRKGVSLKDIRDTIKSKLPELENSMMLFYPTRTEMRKEGHRRISQEIPYLPDILFFKIQHNKVKNLFANIGDMAWCYKTSNSADSDYFVISNKQMTAFQQCVGQFTPDIRMELTQIERPLEKGRRVKVVGGMMDGYEGEILDIEGEPGKRVFFLAISGDTQARWTAHVDDLYIHPLPTI